MNEMDFNELLDSVKEAGKIRRGEMNPSRMFRIDDPNVASIRGKYHMSQSEFAALLGISLATLQNWEQGRRRPQGPARVLLHIADKNPKALLDV
jgi:putative transcriptional regulator